MDPKHCVVSPEFPLSFSEVVENVRNGDPRGLDQLYSVFRMFTGSLRRHIGYQDFEDRLHDVFLLVVDAIRDGRLREPSALPGYIHGVARISVCSAIGVRSRHRRLNNSLRHWVTSSSERRSPEEELLYQQRVNLMRQMVAALSAREREVLTRYYLKEQSREQICRELDLTETQFRLTKSRAKQRLERVCSVHLSRDREAA